MILQVGRLVEKGFNGACGRGMFGNSRRLNGTGRLVGEYTKVPLILWEEQIEPKMKVLDEKCPFQGGDYTLEISKN